MSCQWGAFPTARFPVCFALSYDDKIEIFIVLQTHRDLSEDSSETGVIM